MYILILIVHVVVCVFLIGVILLQGGRGGLSETLGGGTAQSLFGGQVANVLTRLTAIVASVFVVTCLSLAYLSTQRGRSVMEQMPMISPEGLPGVLPPGVQSQTQTLQVGPDGKVMPAEPTTTPDASSPDQPPANAPAAPAATTPSEPAASEPAPAAPATP